MARSPGHRLAVLAAALLCGGCRDAFLTDAPRQAQLQPRAGAWRDTFAVADVDTLALLGILPGGDSLADLNVTWTSSDPSVLALQPVAGGGAGTTSSRLRIIASALKRGRVQITARVTQTGFDSVAFRDSVVVLERWIAVSAGYRHTCAVAVDSTAYCWGNGALGDGSPSSRSFAPLRVVAATGDARYRAIFAGLYRDSCGMVVGGAVLCWGVNQYGELGNGLTNVAQPVAVLAVNSQTFASFGLAAQHGCAVSVPQATGVAPAYCWGQNLYGRLGTSTASAVIPQLVKFSGFFFPTFRVVAAGPYHGCVTSAVPAGLYCWGLNVVGQLGTGLAATPACSGGPSLPCATAGLFVPGFDSSTVLAAGGWPDSLRLGHTCALAGGSLFCWGGNSDGQLGAPSDSVCTEPSGASQPCSPVPKLVATSARFVAIGTGGKHTCGLAGSGQVWCWGANDYGQLGNGGFTGRATPDTIIGAGRFVSLSVGTAHACAIRSGDGALYCWGRNADCALGRADAAPSSAPVRVAEPAAQAEPCSAF